MHAHSKVAIGSSKIEKSVFLKINIYLKIDNNFATGAMETHLVLANQFKDE
jgi:hypothetical protein